MIRNVENKQEVIIQENISGDLTMSNAAATSSETTKTKIDEFEMSPSECMRAGALTTLLTTATERIDAGR